jgi:hypothetical protein
VLSDENFLAFRNVTVFLAFKGQLDCLTTEDGGTKIVRNAVVLIIKDTVSYP